MRINNNLMAMNTHRQLGVANNQGAKSMEKLSSGQRINRAGDDAAGLAISEKMRGQIRGLNQASSNAQDGISLIQTAEGALNETHAILQRMRELAVQSATDTNTADDRAKIQGEVDQLAKEITRISNDTEFNTQNLMAGGLDNTFHVGANEGQNVELAINGMDASSLGIARDGITATLNDTAANMTDVKLGNDVGTAVVNGASIDVTTTATNDVKGTITLGGVTVTTDNNTDAYNDYEITIVDGTTEEIAVDHDAKTIVITADIANTASAAEDITVSYSGTAPAGSGGLTFAGSTPTAVGTAETIGADGTAGSAAGISVEFDDGTTQQTVTVAANATSVSVKDGDFKGVSFESADLVNASGTITIATETAAAAVVGTDGSVTTKAVAPKGVDVSSQTAADSAITTINDALETVSAERSKLGALQNRLEHTIKNLDTSAENLQASEARIRDVDMAKEMMEQTKQNILAQASTAMLANANQSPQSVLQLLG